MALFDQSGKIKNPIKKTGFFKRIWHLPTLPGVSQVPSAIRGLTSLFGMGRGEHPWKKHHKNLIHLLCFDELFVSNRIDIAAASNGSALAKALAEK